MEYKEKITVGNFSVEVDEGYKEKELNDYF
jgi:hypothetical protein